MPIIRTLGREVDSDPIIRRLDPYEAALQKGQGPLEGCWFQHRVLGIAKDQAQVTSDWTLPLPYASVLFKHISEM